MIEHEIARQRILDWIAKTPAWKRWFLWKLFQKDFCPYCQRVTKWRWWRNPEIQPNDPPLFTQWICLECGEGTGIKPTPGVIKALRTLEWLDDMTEYNQRHPPPAQPPKGAK